MGTQQRQHELPGVTRAMYHAAAGLVRGARYSNRRRREVWVVRHFFSRRGAWYRAVQTACAVHGVDFMGYPPPPSSGFTNPRF